MAILRRPDRRTRAASWAWSKDRLRIAIPGIAGLAAVGLLNIGIRERSWWTFAAGVAAAAVAVLLWRALRHWRMRL